MANLITNTTLVNTERKIVIKYSEIGVDVTSNSTTVVDITDSAFDSIEGKALTGVAIEKIYLLPAIGVGATAQIAGHIEWATSDSAAEVPITNVTSEYRNTAGSTFDFSAWGGLTKEGATANGNIKLDVTGIGGSEGYAFVLEMRKIF
jgi:hypothetical protein